MPTTLGGIIDAASDKMSDLMAEISPPQFLTSAPDSSAPNAAAPSSSGSAWLLPVALLAAAVAAVVLFIKKGKGRSKKVSLRG